MLWVCTHPSFGGPDQLVLSSSHRPLFPTWPHPPQAVLASGISSVAVVLKHAAIYPRHEQLVGELARGMGFKQVGGTGGPAALGRAVQVVQSRLGGRYRRSSRACETLLSRTSHES